MRDSLGDWRCGSVKLFMSTRCWGDGPNPLFGDTPLRKGDFDVNIIVEPGKMQPLNQDNIDNLFVRSFGVVFSIQVDIPQHRYRE